jgi:hypothetical protein
MTVDLENDLARTLSAAATAAPEPEGDFAAGVARRRRRNERVRTVGLACAAAVVVVVSGTVAVVGLRGGPANVAPAATGSASAAADPTAGSSIDLSTVPLAERVWPGAVVTVPTVLPDGRRIARRQFVDRERLLVVPGSDTRRYDLPVVYDLRTGQSQELMIAQAGYSYADASVGDRSILLIVAVDGRPGARELWTAPRTGGPLVKRAAFSTGPYTTEQMRTTAFEAGDALFVSFVGKAAGVPDVVHRVRADGTTEKVAGTDGWQGRWPMSPWLIQSYTGPTSGFWNVMTDERRTPRPLDGLELMGCAVQSCAGRGSDGSVVIYSWDGGGPRFRATGLPDRDATEVIFDASGRFAQIRVPGGFYLWDLQTNTAGRINATLVFDLGLMSLGKPIDGRDRVISTALIP